MHGDGGMARIGEAGAEPVGCFSGTSVEGVVERVWKGRFGGGVFEAFWNDVFLKIDSKRKN